MKKFKNLRKNYFKPLKREDVLRLAVDEIGGDEAKACIKLLKTLTDEKAPSVNNDLMRIFKDCFLSGKYKEDGDAFTELMVNCMYYGIYIAVKERITKVN